jgi:putative transposase
MARKMRIQYAGALYHVVNRGNYRRDLFLTPGECQAFVDTLEEGVKMMGWRLHAYVLMSNHYHLALETPEPNLVEGMHWVQSAWGTRFNRFRKEQGHLFQGRYKALLLENAAALGRVVDYIHLNPVRAKVVAPELVGKVRWSSLSRILKGDRVIASDGWNLGCRFGQGLEGSRTYEAYLIEIGQDEQAWERLGLTDLSKGWAVGTAGWRKALAKEYGQMALSPGLERAEVAELRHATWELAVERGLQAQGRTDADLVTKPLRTDWKVRLARTIRQESGASISWLATRLNLGSPQSVRGYLWKDRQNHSQNTA